MWAYRLWLCSCRLYPSLCVFWYPAPCSRRWRLRSTHDQKHHRCRPPDGWRYSTGRQWWRQNGQKSPQGTKDSSRNCSFLWRLFSWHGKSYEHTTGTLFPTCHQAYPRNHPYDRGPYCSWACLRSQWQCLLRCHKFSYLRSPLRQQARKPQVWRSSRRTPRQTQCLGFCTLAQGARKSPHALAISLGWRLSWLAYRV